MPNVLFSQVCVRSCPYCFAKKYMGDSSPEDFISWENLIYLADFFIKSGEKRFHILGGEPTLHPDFNNMVLYLLERGFEITVFTSGIIESSKLKEAENYFKDVHPLQLSFLCNLNEPNSSLASIEELKKVREFLYTFGNRITPGFNIYKKNYRLDFIVDYINTYNLRRNIRIGLTHPIPGEKNAFLKLEHLREAIDRLYSYKDIFEQFRIKPGLDCGFPLCVFNDEQLGWLYRITGGRYDFGCNVVIDIGPDMNLWSCFPLSSFHKKSVFEFDSISDIREYYLKLHDAIKNEESGVFFECDNCNYREENLCRGGCLAHPMMHFKEEYPIRTQEIYE